MERAVVEMTAVLAEVNASGAEADAMWVEFIARVWPVAHRYRVLLALRRGEYGEAIHGLLPGGDDHEPADAWEFPRPVQSLSRATSPDSRHST